VIAPPPERRATNPFISSSEMIDFGFKVPTLRLVIFMWQFLDQAGQVIG
jgi:hypothetical protein